MNKKYLIVCIVITFISLTLGITLGVYFSKNTSENKNKVENTTNNETSESNEFNIPTTGNDTVITTNSKTTLRVINEYDTSFFTAKKNLLIMFGSWCEHCQEEIKDIEEIVNYYYADKDVNVILIAHEYDDTISDLKDLVENDVNFKDTEVLIDLGRIIRKEIDPEASTVPISYVVDKDGNILNKHNEAITLDVAKEMLK